MLYSLGFGALDDSDLVEHFIFNIMDKGFQKSLF